MHNVELLAPARDLDELKVNIDNGADAIYLGGEVFGMSSVSGFSDADMKEAIEYAHKNNSRVYTIINILPHDDDFNEIESYLKRLEEINVDAIVISDPGMLSIIKNVVPNMEVHLSDQANTTNYITAKFWYDQGIKRVALSKELSCEEIGKIRANTTLDLDLEVYAHGVMTLSYSGRPLLSNYLKDKNSDKQINKKTYSLMEDKRPGEYFPVYEDEKGTFLFNTKDLCMLEYIPELVKSGVTSLKIEGRMKDSAYINAVVKAYKIALDEFYKNQNDWKFKPEWIEEIKSISNREFTTGFYIDNQND